ncbi:MAG: cache domain-containing protein [Terriglobales bacterium]
MPLDSPDIRTSLKKLLVGLILVLVPVTVFGFYVALQGDNYIRQMNGGHFRSITQTSADLTGEFIGGLVRDVSAIANNPSLVQAVASANRQYDRLDSEAVHNKVDAIEKKWNSPETDALAKSILTSDLARMLRRDRELNPRLLRVTVADVTGSTVAATDKPSHYFQPDREYGQELDSRGQGAIHLTDLRYEEKSHLYYLTVAYPVLQEGTGRFIGAVIALVDLSPLFTRLSRQQIARTGRLFLVRDDGTVIQSPGVTPSMKIKSEEYAAIRDALGTLRGREAGYIYATLSHGVPYLIGFADTGLREAYPNLPWIVIASQEESEASGPVRNMAGFALLMMIFALLMLTLLAAYVFLHRPQKLEDIETPPNGKLPPVAA